MDDPAASAAPADSGVAGSGVDRARRLFRYLSGDEWAQYRAIMAVFADTFFAEFSPHDVLARLDDLLATGGPYDGPAGGPDGGSGAEPWTIDIVEARLESLHGWGNLTVSTSVGNPSSLQDYYRRRNLYLITRGGQEVHDLVEGVLARIDDIRDMQAGRLRAIHNGLLALDRLVGGGVDGVPPVELADAVRLVFDIHEAFTEEITQFFASLNQWQSRYDLDGEDLQFFAEILVGYVSEQLVEIERLARPIALVLVDLEPSLDAIVARADTGLARRVDDAGLGLRVSVGSPVGSRRQDWDYLQSWYRASGGARSRLDALTSQAVSAVRTLTANLTRLSGVGIGSASRRADFVKLARWIDAAASPDEAHHLVAAAFGLGPSRHLGALAADDDDPVPASTPWPDAPRAVVPVSLRRRGESTMRGRPSRIQDRSKEKELLRRRREREAEAEKRAAVELLDRAGPDGSVDGITLSPAAFRRLRDLVGRSSHHLRAGQLRRVVRDHQLVCEVERRQGAETTVETDEGRLRLIDLDVRLRPAVEPGPAVSTAGPTG